MPDSFSKKLEIAFKTKGQLCVGIDPHENLLADNGFDISADGLESFSYDMLDQLQDEVSIIKPQVSFFERFGSEGFRALENVLREANERGFLVIADAKRGDIGSTMEAYGQAWLAKDAPFVCDALTVNPYLGVGALSSAVAFASERGKGLFVLAATSNLDGLRLQSSMNNGATVASQIAQEVETLNINTAISNSRFGSVGLVVGATVNLKQIGIDSLNADRESLRTSILAPGFGYQGVELSRAKEIFGEVSGDVIYTVSRSALRNGIEAVASSVRQDQETLKLALAQ
ncbi:MAG: orotidine-5'-phosphate decarboxylase [Rhodoluna sp.]